MIVTTHNLCLQFDRPGQLVPWLGFALRGWAMGQYKDRLCHFPASDVERRKFCAGCPHMQTCGYGQLFEPDVPAGVEVFRGQDDAPRPLVLSPYYPLPERASAGFRLPVTATAIGTEAARHVRSFVDFLAEVGPCGGLGPNDIGFDVEEQEDDAGNTIELNGDGFPARPDAIAGRLPRVGVGLTSPLLLKRRLDNGKRQANRCPSFSDLFRASLRIIGRLFTVYDRPLDVDFAALAEASRDVRTLDDCYEPFEQGRWSGRQHKHYNVLGVVGGAIFADVPMSLLPWLYWAGRLHVGDHRQAGAGRWRIVLE